MPINEVKTQRSGQGQFANDGNSDADIELRKTRSSKRRSHNHTQQENHDLEVASSLEAIQLEQNESTKKSNSSDAAAAVSTVLPATTTTTSTSTLSSSTPRRKLHILSNLQSTLSPKYIDFATPPPTAMATPTTTTSNSDQRKRSIRRLNLNRSVNSLNNEITLLNSTNTPPEAAAIGCIRRTRSSASIVPAGVTESPDTKIAALTKAFVSPIDKLLQKNGATPFDKSDQNKKIVSEIMSPNAKIELSHVQTSPTLLHGNGESVNAPACETKLIENDLNNANGDATMVTSENQQEDVIDTMISADLVKAQQTSIEVIEEKNEGAIGESSDIQKTLQSEEFANTTAIDALGVASSSTGDYDNAHNLENPSIASKIDCNEELHIKLSENREHETSFGTSEAIGGGIDANAKSPSAVSTDSAKGSSVITGMSWMAFSTGDLFWGQIYSYCYWPCMVCPDPDGKTIMTEKSGRNGSHYVLVHVRFFADNGRRNWVKRQNLIPYIGVEKYKERIREVRDKYGKRSTKYKLLVPKQSRLQTWQEAVKEANMVADVLYSDRLEKFYEIYENSKTTREVERKRRQSMITLQETCSDIGSLCGSNDTATTYEQIGRHSLVVAVKRDRSASPFSPAFSPVKPALIKKRKLSEPPNEQVADEMPNQASPNERHTSLNQTNPTASTSASSTYSPLLLQDATLFSGTDFKKFYMAMKDFVMMQNSDEKLERSLMVAVRNIWALKQINHSQMERRLIENLKPNELGSSLIENNNTRGEGSVKRLSNRLKFLKIRRSLPLQSDAGPLQPTAAETHPIVTHIKEEKPKKQQQPLNRPIEEVIDDIFNLDNKYLFKGLGRDPVCKYCFRPDGKLERCFKGCQSWLHRECIMTDKNNTKTLKMMTDKRRSGRRSKEMSSKIGAGVAVGATYVAENPIVEEPTVVCDETNLNEGDSKTVEAFAELEPIICQECLENKKPTCCVCQLETAADTELVFCCMAQCSKAFHPGCCRYWPQAKITKSKNAVESFRCPSHVCHTCVSDDPKGKFQHLSNAKLTKCVKCPASYHMDSTCVPAGSEILTAAHIICPRHGKSKSDGHVNVSWCFICVGGGQVICCESCPTAVHSQCLNIPIEPNEGYICEECESGRLPLYGEMVWAKFNSFRWWPAIILPPTEIPHNILRKAHSPLEFVVRFFGTHDHGWISRRRVYLYLEGDSSEPPKSKSYLDISYNRGVDEARKIYEIVKLKKQTQQLLNESKEKLHPQPYVRIKANRAVLPVKLHIDMEKVNKCECDPNGEAPCGPDSDCLNRVLYHECNPKICPAGELCQNQMFESKISPRLDVVYMKERGFGLVCCEPISAGTFIIEYVGEIINDDEFQQRMAQMSTDRDENFYFLSVEKDYIIDAGPKGNMARFMNHSCDPNCETQKWSVNGLNRIGLFAIKDIPANSELTFNYHWDDLLGNEKKTCFCGSKKCSGQIGAKYKEEKPAKDNLDVQNKTKGKLARVKKAKPLKRLQNKKQRKTTKSKKSDNIEQMQQQEQHNYEDMEPSTSSPQTTDQQHP